MKNACKGKCEKYITSKRYWNGAVRCRTCYEFLDWQGLWCPCCKCRVSGRARGKVSKSLNDKLETAARM